MIALEHRVSFTGSVTYADKSASHEPTLILDDSGVATASDYDRLAASLVQVVQMSERPTFATVETLAARLETGDVTRLVAIGSGAAIDAAKLAYRHAAGAGIEIEPVFVPCAREPYRAVARFAVVDELDGSRPTVVDPRFAAAQVVVSPKLLSRVPRRVLAIGALDTAVHAVESLLSRKADPFSRLLACSALRAVCEDPLRPELLLTASFIAVEAFASTRLGLAHAIASPLGAELGVTHDSFNGVLGQPLVEYWGDRSAGFREIAAACGVTTVAAVSSCVRRLREAAELPPSLSELNVEWDDVLRVLPRAAQSSGIEVLPFPLADGALESFASRAWQATHTKEERLAGPA